MDTPSRSDRAWLDLPASGTRARAPLCPPELVGAARTGDRDAIGAVGAAAFPRVLAFFRYSGLSESEAEDLAASVVEAIVSGIDGLRDDAAFDAWMWGAARNKLRGWIRKQRRPPRYEPPAVRAATPLETVELAEEHATIRRALAALSPRDRELLWLREVEGLSYAEIGGRLGAATGAVRVACHRARMRLETAYRRLEGD